MQAKGIQKKIDYAIVLVAVFILSSPVFLAVMSSLKQGKDIFTRVPKFIFVPTAENYYWIFYAREIEMFRQGMINSLIITAAAIVLTLAVSLPAAYAYSRFDVKGVKRTALVLIGIKMFPSIIIAVPLYPMLASIGWIDKPWTLVLLYVAFQISMTTLLLKVFIDAIPRELDEAALMDGCNRIQTLFKVVIPIIGPGLIAAAIFIALLSWNDYLFSSLFTNNEARTAPVVIGEILHNVEQSFPGWTWGKAFAACTIQMLPILIFIWIIQQKLFTGFTIGAVKG